MYDKWDEERHEKKLEEVFGNCFEEVTADNEFLKDPNICKNFKSYLIMDELITMEWYFNKFKDDFDYETLEYAALDPEFEYATTKYNNFEDDPPKFLSKSIFVSKYSMDKFPHIYNWVVYNRLQISL